MKQRYFTHFSGFNMPKNKLQTAVVALFKELNGYIVPNMEDWVTKVSANIKQLNEAHAKCKAIQINNWSINDGIAFGCGNEWTCIIYLYKIKEG